MWDITAGWLLGYLQTMCTFGTIFRLIVQSGLADIRDGGGGTERSEYDLLRDGGGWRGGDGCDGGGYYNVGGVYCPPNVLLGPILLGDV